MEIEKILGAVFLIAFFAYIANWMLFAPSVGTWSKWFAWYPVKIEDHWYYFRIVERRKEFTGASSETDFDWVVYRLPTNQP